jgi:uncharacterized protein (TIGR03000 family)
MFAARLSAQAALVALLLAVAVGAQDKKGDKDDKKGEKKPAVIIVKVIADAKLEFDGVTTTKTGAVRKFTTPELALGKKYTYTVKATWEPSNYETITRTRKVVFEPGKETELDMTKEDPAQPDHIVIRYVPTPQVVVDAMLKLGKATKGDVVYDLGCGDGRIVITAVSKFGAKKGVGVDLDPERIKDSNENAKKAGVTDKVEFRRGDVMKIADLGQATLVCLYLADSLNEQLMPILKKQCKPGTRIVSHRFLMGDWKPEKTEVVEHDTRRDRIHLWTIGKAEKKDDKDKGKDKDK